MVCAFAQSCKTVFRAGLQVVSPQAVSGVILLGFKGLSNTGLTGVSLANQVISAGSGTAVQLTEEQKALVRAKAIQGLVRALAAQGLMAVVAALVSWVFGGGLAALSALLGAAAYLVPNSLFALRLLLGLLSGKGANPAGFLVGELIKLFAATGLLALVVYLGQSWLVWPALIFGLVMALKGYALLLMSGKLV